MIRIFKLALSMLALLTINSACDKKFDNSISGALEIKASQTIIQSNGIDEIEFIILLDNVEIAHDYQIICDNEPIVGNKFSTKKAGTYTFIATYKNLESNILKIQAIDATIPNKPSTKDSKVRTLISLFPFVPHPDMNPSESIVNYLRTNELTKDKIIVNTAQSYSPQHTQYFPSDLYSDRVGIDVPGWTINHKNSSSIRTAEDATVACLVENETQKKTAATLGIKSIIENDNIVTRVLIQPTTDLTYYIGAFLIENDVTINITINTKKNTYKYDGLVRHIDCPTQYMGHELGKRTAGEEVEYIFAWNLKNILATYATPENGWSEINKSNIRVIVYLYSSNEEDRHYMEFNNVAESVPEIMN